MGGSHWAMDGFVENLWDDDCGYPHDAVTQVERLGVGSILAGELPT